VARLPALVVKRLIPFGCNATELEPRIFGEGLLSSLVGNRIRHGAVELEARAGAAWQHSSGLMCADIIRKRNVASFWPQITQPFSIAWKGRKRQNATKAAFSCQLEGLIERFGEGSGRVRV
jgi:hypothetical protein